MKKLIIFSIVLVSCFVVFRIISTNPIKNKTNVLKVSERDFPQERLDWEFKLLRDPATNKIPKNIRAKELQFSRTIPNAELLRKKSLNKTNKFFDIGTWKSIGPENIGGRTRALAIDVSDNTSNTILAGWVSGGMWRSTNGGTSWTRVTTLPQLASVTTLAQDTRSGKTNIWYYGQEKK